MRFIFITLIAVLSNQLVYNQSNAKVDSLLRLADMRISSDALESALKYIDFAFEIDDLNEKAYLLRARVYAQQGKYDAALKDLETIKQINPDNLDVIYARAEVYYLQKDFKTSGKILGQAIDKYPELGEFYYYRGLLLNEEKKYSKSISDFEKALELKSKIEPYKIYLNKGVAHLYLLEFDQALQDHNKAIELYSKDASAFHSRGMVYYAMGAYEDAIADFSNALQMFSENPETFFNLGMSYFQLEDKDNACLYFHKSCKNGNKNGCKMILLECGQ